MTSAFVDFFPRPRASRIEPNTLQAAEGSTVALVLWKTALRLSKAALKLVRLVAEIRLEGMMGRLQPLHSFRLRTKIDSSLVEVLFLVGEGNVLRDGRGLKRCRRD